MISGAALPFMRAMGNAGTHLTGQGRLPLSLTQAASHFFKRWRVPLIAAFYLVLLSFCVHAIRTTLQETGLRQFAASLTALGPVIVFQAALCVAGVYAVMCLIEQLVLRDVGARLPLGAAIATPLIANSLSIGLGFGALSGAAIRVRIYSRSGVDAQTCVLIASGVTLVSLAGGGVLALLGMTFEPEAIASRLGLHVGMLRTIGIAGLLGIVAVLIAAGGRRQRLKLLGRQIHLPSARSGVVRLAAGAIDWLMSATVLFLLLPESAQTHWLAFAAFFACLHFIAMATGAPAGIGVFDAAMIGLNPTDASSGQLAAALVVYRLLSFIVPLFFGLIGLLFLESHRDFGLHRRRSTILHAPNATTVFLQRVMRRGVHFATQRLVPPLRRNAAKRTVTSRKPVGALLKDVRHAPLTSLRALTRDAPILVLAPHPDDECLGCGAVLAACAKRGIPAHVALLTNGALSHPGSLSWSPHRIAARRALEAQHAMQRLGLKPHALWQLRMRDGGLLLNRREMRTAALRLTRLVRRLRVQTIFVAWRHDPHPDHAAAALIADEVRAKLPNVRMLEFPVWGRLLPKDVTIRDGPWKAVRFDAKPWQIAKKRALFAYRSQTSALIADAPIALRLQRDQVDAMLTRNEIFLYRPR